MDVDLEWVRFPTGALKNDPIAALHCSVLIPIGTIAHGEQPRDATSRSVKFGINHVFIGPGEGKKKIRGALGNIRNFVLGGGIKIHIHTRNNKITTTIQS